MSRGLNASVSSSTIVFRIWPYGSSHLALSEASHRGTRRKWDFCYTVLDSQYDSYFNHPSTMLCRLLCMVIFTIIPIGLLSGTSTCVLAAAVEFRWNADLNSATGLANSYESSSLPRTNFNHDILSTLEEQFVAYPQFLGRRKVLLGLLVAKPGVQDAGNKPPTTQICDALFGVNLLTFGEPKTSTFHEKIVDDSGNYIANKGVLSSIPVLGGLLACCVGDEASATSSKERLGELRFQLTQNAKHGLRIETRMVDYRPSIAGMPPVDCLRKSLYSSSQRLMHAYVMWRFHNHCYSML